MQEDLFQTATSSQQDTLVNPLVLPASKEARKMTAISGRKYLPLLKQNSLAGAFSRMFMDTSAWASTKCYLTWRGKVTPAKRLLFQLVPSMPRTDETEFGLWPTPLAQEAKHSTPTDWEMATSHAGTAFSLRVKVAKANLEMWATPRTTDGTGGPRKLDEKGRRISQTNPDLVFGANLADQVRMWPTPTTRDHKGGYLGGRIRDGKVSMDTLDVAVQHTDNQHKTGGQLNPQWVEWLMGYPEGWTDLKD